MWDFTHPNTSSTISDTWQADDETETETEREAREKLDWELELDAERERIEWEILSYYADGD